MLANVLIPISELFLEVKDRLHRIAKNAGWKCRCHIVDDGMLRDIAVLIFINEQATVGGCKHVKPMPRFKPSGGSHANIGIVSSWVFELEKIRIAPAAFRKRGNKTHRPSVNSGKTIRFGGHTCFLQSASQGGHAGVGVR